MASYRLHDTTGDDLGLLEHPAPNVEPGDVVVLTDGREAIVTARVEVQPGPLAAMLKVVLATETSAPQEKAPRVVMSPWAQMDARPRSVIIGLSESRIPTSPGAYALYREGAPVYVGKATSLRARLWRNHLRQGTSMTNSALRRNVAELLGIAAAAAIKSRRYTPTAADARLVSGWIHECELAWIECETVAEAETLEALLKSEWRPPLTKR